ncbi:hypothetical protein [Bradyrhizobium liaoningense]|uniref:hypothetical protein n=1 Tax=Bradyrhizobium liaoningense TaxID=43992 RepID=UPI001BA4B1E9|nr:hypothetical protein [Bradyrhizobium liaoningense]MBR0818735.1 hypothetical protein [Bradyrhizobium liaoningense]
MFTLSRTPTFRDFQRRLGNCTFHINAAYVGLEWIARGQGKPDDLRINWDVPKKPREAVDQARQLIHSAMLGHVHDALDSYLRQVADVPWTHLSSNQRDILRKSITRPGKGAYSIADRFTELKLELTDKAQLVDFELMRVLVAWRNQHVHEGLNEAGEFRLPDGAENVLIAEKEMLAKRYGGFDPGILFGHFVQRAAPKRKEIIALVSASQNYVRAADGVLLQRSITRKEDLESIARTTIKEALCRSTYAEIKKLWGKDTTARMRRLKAILEAGGFVSPGPERDTPLSSAISLSTEFIERFAGRPVQQAIEILNSVESANVAR